MLSALLTGAPLQARERTELNAGWRHYRGPATGAERATFDDREWPAVTLPHTFNGSDGDDGDTYYRGPGWYRRTLTADLAPGTRAILQFDGAATVTDVWINGRFVGQHAGGYARFRFDITPYLVRGANSLAVRVDNTKRPDVAPLGGDFTVFGGLYRAVSLLIVPGVHLDAGDHGSDGVRLFQRNVSAAGADLEIRSRITNDRAVPAQVAVTTTVRDAAGRVVGRASGRIDVPGRATRPITQSLHIARPHLWNGTGDPYLHSVTVETSAGGSRDRAREPLGFRSIALDPSRGLLLNGRPYAVRGVNYFHPGRPGVGLAVGDAEIAQDIAILREMGATGLRLVHFQHPERVYQLADKLGLLVWTEVPLNGPTDPGTDFADNLATQMRELIAQTGNHPSVIIWGIGNEVWPSADTRRLMARLREVAHEEDPTRPTSYAHCCIADLDPQARIAEVTGYNRYYGWYTGSLDQIGAWADDVHTRAPDLPMSISEYGAGASILHHGMPAAGPPTPPGRWHPEEYQAAFHEAYWRQLRARPWLWSTFIWTAFDLASDGRDEGDRPGINDKGLVSYDRKVRKDAYFWYQANWSAALMVHLAGRRDTPRRDTGGPDLRAYSNGEVVEARIDGRVLPPVSVVDHVASWQRLDLAEGFHRIELVARRGAATARDAATIEVWRTPVAERLVIAAGTPADHGYSGGAACSGSASCRRGTFAYHIPVRPGWWTVEVAIPADRGARRFTISAEQRRMAGNIDATAATTRSFTIEVTDETLDLEFVPITGVAVARSITITRK
ncbi:MAG TPA: glycoside hydrolase family 2 TIM barrel-domain containing protein [Sphingomonas sp.]|nr:glycoside hydrolase family 2 TIM barrel-domain containing protein [Sphingomonas sp.]